MYISTLIALTGAFFAPAYGLDLDTSSSDSVKSAASKIASGLVSLYNGTEPGHVIGVLDIPYNWWEAGALWHTLVQYWSLTGDDQYNDIVTQALVFQKGQHDDYLPANFTNVIANDDQATWALAALSAAEAQLPDPEGLTWVTLADNVFNEQILRWDLDSCKGGLRWQILPFLTGYTYKNSAAGGNLFKLAARLARYTGNSTYSDWAAKSYDWSTSVGFVDETFKVFDGASVESNCTSINKLQLSLPAGLYISGAATMYNITTGDDQEKWKTVLDGLLKYNLDLFFPNGTAYEVACEEIWTCTTEMKLYKGLLAQALVETIQVVPYTAALILPLLTSSAQAAAEHCDSDGLKCKFGWTTDPSRQYLFSASKVSEQISALSYVQALLVKDASAPFTEEEEGGSTVTDPTPTSGGSTTGTVAPSTTNSGSGTAPSQTPNGGNREQALGLSKLAMVVSVTGLVAFILM